MESELNSVHERASRLIEVGRYREAKQHLAEGFALAPDDLVCHVLAAEIAYQEDDWGAMEHHVHAALNGSPHDYDARRLLALVLKETGRPADAERVLIDLLRDYPQDAYLYARYAQLMLEALLVDKAEALVAEARRLDPEDELVAVIAIMCELARGRTDGAAEQLEALVRSDPQAHHVLTTMLLVFYEQGRYDECLLIARQVLRHAPDDENAVAVLVALKALTHWSMRPLQLAQRRLGVFAPGVTWFVLIAAMLLARETGSEVVMVAVAVLAVGFIVYSWVYPPFLVWWFRKRGF